MTEKMKMLETLMRDLTESVEKYEKAKEKYQSPCARYEVSTFDSRESIKRRIIVIREELLKVSKMMGG